jgi:hypothetical protein
MNSFTFIYLLFFPGFTSRIAGPVMTRCSTCHSTSGAWVHAPPPMKATKPVEWERLLLLYLPTSLVRVTATCNKGKTHKQQLIFIFLSFFRFASLLFLLWIYFTAGQFVLGFVFFSSASGGRSGGCRGGGGVDDLYSCWLSRRLGLLRVGFDGDQSAPIMDCGQRWS